MTERDYHERLRGVLSRPQFVESILCWAQKKPVVLQIEEKFNKTIAQLKHRGSIDTDFYNKVRSSGGQPARLYGLTKVHKKDTPLRPVLSIPGSCYEPITNELAKWFEKLPEAQVETSSSKIKAGITAATLDDDEVMLSLDVKSLYTNAPVEESTELAADLVYSRDVVPDFSRATFAEMLKLAVQNVHSLCDSKWYVQVDGLAMGSKLAVYLANIWMKQFEDVISGRGSFTTHGRTQSAPDPGGSVIASDAGPRFPCVSCGDNVGRASVQCRRCGFWYHRRCTNLSVADLRRLSSGEWLCGCGVRSGQGSAVNHPPLSSPAKIFARYVDDIIRSIKRHEISSLLQAANQLHANLQFTMELETDQQIPFLDMLIERREYKLSTAWYSKPTDTGVYLSYHACAPTKYKRNYVEGAVHRIHHTTPHPVGWPSTVASKHWQSDWKPTSIRLTFMGRLFVIQLLRSSVYSRVKQHRR